MSIDETRFFSISSICSISEATTLSQGELVQRCEQLLQRCTERSSAEQGSLYSGGLGPHTFLRLQLAQNCQEDTKIMILLEQAKQAAASVLESGGDNSRATLLTSSKIGALCMLAVTQNRIMMQNRHKTSTGTATSTSKSHLSCKVLADQIVEELDKKCSRLAPEECEVLYGRAGALLAVFFLRKELDLPELGSEFVIQTALDILRQGLKGAKSVHRTQIIGGRLPLLWQWHGKLYLGAAHGIVGILHVLLSIRADEWEQIEKELPNIKSTIRETVVALVSLCHVSGNLVSSLSVQHPRSKKDRLVHWCHGAPGHCLLLIKASQVFEEPQFLHLAEHIAETVIWPRGLLRKGVGLCHGISGNGFIFLYLSETLSSGPCSQKWRGRALQYAHFALQHLPELEQTPDHPYSLFEGLGGLCAFLFSCAMSLDDSTAIVARFPLYDF